MGLINASGSFTRYLVEGTLPDDYPEEFPKRIARYAFRYLDDSSEAERSVGWVNILDIFDSSFQGREYFKEPYFALSWRVDQRTVPSKALKQYCKEAESAGLPKRSWVKINQIRALAAAALEKTWKCNP